MIKFIIFLWFSILSFSGVESWNDKVVLSEKLDKKDRFIYFSKEFLGTKYGFGVIKDKIYDLDEVDCITYIHDVLALSLSECYSQFVKNIMDTTLYDASKIKTKEDLILQKRHFTLLDYILERSNSKYFNIITEKVIPAESLRERKISIDKKSFFKKVYNLDTDYEINPIEFKYAKAADLDKYYENIKIALNEEKILIALLVPNEKTFANIKKSINSDIDIHHLGLLVLNKKGEIIFRHAAFGKEVLDIDFRNYTKENIEKKMDGFLFVSLKI